MEPTDAEKLKAQRVQRLLYLLIVLMVGIPLVLLLTRALRFH